MFLAAPAAPASADVGRLCLGYSACAKAGYSSAGYDNAGKQMYWRMYAGHNCTNYAAYRMVRSGLPNVRPWTGSGNATYWGSSMASITDRTPAVGAVAWWKAGVYPAGSAGHVAYVERVVSADEIIVSQDSWGGEFSWARVTRGRGWPSGFIHFNDVPLLNTAKPTIRRAAKVGAILRASAGSWSVEGVSVSYQWRVGDTDVPGATADRLEVTEAMQGKRVRVVVTASRIGYPVVRATSPATSVVAPGVLTATVAPAITAPPVVGTPVSVDPGVWNTTPDTLTYRWAADGTPLPDGDQATFTPGPELVGRTLTVSATARKKGYGGVTVVSPPSAPVEPGTLAVAGTTSVEGGPRLGETLRLASMPLAPGAETRIQWLVGGVPVPDATGPAYRLSGSDLGKRVRARVVLSRPGYRTLTIASAATPRVRSVPVLTTVTRRRAVTVRAAAAGIPKLSGTVRLRAGNRVVAEAPLRAGKAWLALSGRTPSRLAVVLLGTPTTERVEKRIRV